MCGVHKKISLELLEPFLHSFKGLKFIKLWISEGVLFHNFQTKVLILFSGLKYYNSSRSIMTKKVHKNNNILQVPKYAVE